MFGLEVGFGASQSLTALRAGFTLQALTQNKFGWIWLAVSMKEAPAQLRAPCLGWQRCCRLLRAASSDTHLC